MTNRNLFHHSINSEPVGMYPYDVFDNGITFGYGRHVHFNGLHGINGWSVDDIGIALLDRYGVRQFVNNRGNPNNLRAQPRIRTDGGHPRFMTFADAHSLLISRVEDDVNTINSFLGDNNISTTQQEFDALVMHRYLNGSLGAAVIGLLDSGNRNRSDWNMVVANSTGSVFSQGWNDRGGRTLSLFFDGNYSYVESELPGL